MPEYTLPHNLTGEEQRLTLMSELLDPIEVGCFAQLGVGKGWKCLELGCGNGSISRVLAEIVAPTGRVVASDIDLAYVAKLKAPGLEIRRIDVLQDDLGVNCYDLVVARALLHHLPSAHDVLQRMVAAVKPGGALLSIEPDMLPCTVAEPESMRAFWQGWLKWSAQAGIDYFIGRRIASWLDSMGLQDVGGEGYTAHFNGGSEWARYWADTMRELAPALLKSDCLSSELLEEIQIRFREPRYWTSVMTFTMNWGRKRRDVN